MHYFEEKDEDSCKLIVEKIINFLNSTPVCSAELIITVHTWIGIL